jgi:hypothetical protein
MNYATITSGRVQLWRKGWNSPLCTVCKDAVNAVVYGTDLIVTFRNGSTTLFRITPNGSNAYALRTTR